MTEMDEQPRKIEPAQWGVIGLVVALTVGALLYRFLMHEQLGHSAAMFLGLPAVLAILLALMPKAQSVTGGIVKGITLALLIVAPLLGEGYLCILIASPLFYLVGILIGLAVDWQRKRRSATLCCVAVLLLPMSLEGVIPQLSFNRSQSVEVTGVVSASEDAVEHALSQSPNLKRTLPAFLRIGFPRPLAAWGKGLEVGDTRTLHFSGAEGDPPGDLVVRVVERRIGYVRVDTISDSSKLTQWIRWTSSEVEWKPLDKGHTIVTWRIHFHRELDPTWYFTPWERMAVRHAAAYMIVANATPVEGN